MPQDAAQTIQQLKVELAATRKALAQAESELAARMSEIHAFEARVDRLLGDLTERLAELEQEIREHNAEIERIRQDRIFGRGYAFDQREPGRERASPEMAPPQVEPEAMSPRDEKEIKKLYRQLARKFHPDLAITETDRTFRTEMMTAINDAYQARSLARLKAIALSGKVPGEAGKPTPVPATPAEVEPDSLQAWRQELARCKRRLQEVQTRLDQLHLNPSVQLSLEVKLARREGRDLLAEMVKDLRNKIARKTVERDFLRDQLSQVGKA